MTEPILDKNYWKDRLEGANHPHEAVFKCPLPLWGKIEFAHKRILKHHIQSNASILDCGCGWGRLLELLPAEWKGKYLGIDVSPDFIALAEDSYPQHEFKIGELIPVLTHLGRAKYDWAVLISIRPMIRRNLGEEAWDQTEKVIRKQARKLLFLEYDPEDRGRVE